MASVSYVAELEVKSRRKGTDFGYRSKFLNSQMLQTPEIEPMNQGTIFVVENLFYNLQTRRESLSISDEKKKILRILLGYSLRFDSMFFIFNSDN